MSRTKEGLTKHSKKSLPTGRVLGERKGLRFRSELNPELEKAGRVADFLEFAEVMCNDALTREESCGGHFREEFKTEEGEARRDDENFCHAAVWEYTGYGNTPNRHKEEMEFEYVKLATRSYK